MRMKEESERVGLRLSIKKIKIMASGPFTAWQIEGESGRSDRFPLPGLQKSLWMVTAAMRSEDDCFLARKR